MLRGTAWIVLFTLFLNALGQCSPYAPKEQPPVTSPSATHSAAAAAEPAVQPAPPLTGGAEAPQSPVLATAVLQVDPQEPPQAPPTEQPLLPPLPPVEPQGPSEIWLPLLSSPPGPPRVIILMIGDGMGFEVVRAARLYTGAELSFERFPFQGSVNTFPAGGDVTDSASAATSMATGRKVGVGVISQSIPGDGSDLPTLLEEQAALGKRTGLVTTSYLTDATIAAMAAHEPTRDNREEIANDYLYQTRPNLLFGGGGRGLTPEEALEAGYVTITDRAGLQALDLNALEYVSGLFGETYMPYELDGLGDYPHLNEMTAAALDLLEEDPDGFFLLVEGGRIDHGEHINDLPRAIAEVMEFSNTVDLVMRWAAERTDTLIIVTADHETGGLRVEQDNGPGEYPTVSWREPNRQHTAAPVPIYAYGVYANLVWGQLDNLEIRSVIYGQR